jgi:hypothetical protein
MSEHGCRPGAVEVRVELEVSDLPLYSWSHGIPAQAREAVRKEFAAIPGLRVEDWFLLAEPISTERITAIFAPQGDGLRRFKTATWDGNKLNFEPFTEDQRPAKITRLSRADHAKSQQTRVPRGRPR